MQTEIKEGVAGSGGGGAAAQAEGANHSDDAALVSVCLGPVPTASSSWHHGDAKHTTSLLNASVGLTSPRTKAAAMCRPPALGKAFSRERSCALAHRWLILRLRPCHSQPRRLNSAAT